MNESFGGGFNNSTVGAVSETKPEGVIPMVIKQILDQNEGIKMFGMTFGIVSFVGIVRHIDHSSTKITYTLEDHTGQISCHLWLDENDTLNAPPVMVNCYARIHGSVRHQGGDSTIMIFKLDPMTSINEITTHLLEALNARYKSEDYFKKSNDTIMDGNSEFTAGGADFSVNHLGLKGKHLTIYQAIKACMNPDGISKTELQAKFNYMTTQEIKDIMEFLYHEGHIFTSIDADHVLATEQ